MTWDVGQGMEGRDMPEAPVNGRSVAAMMRRGLSLVESHLILAPSGGEFKRRRGDEPARR